LNVGAAGGVSVSISQEFPSRSACDGNRGPGRAR
jgi:hypothetical protein